MIADPVTVDEHLSQALARAISNQAMVDMLANIDAQIHLVQDVRRHQR